MTRTEAYRLVKMIGAGCVTYIGFLATHNVRQATDVSLLIIPEFWMTQLEAIASALGAMGLYLAVPPTGVRTIESPAVVVNHLSAAEVPAPSANEPTG